ncbi:MAG: rhomboid family intramembrane serine protease [Ilumatobacteraceae bacterium]
MERPTQLPGHPAARRHQRRRLLVPHPLRQRQLGGSQVTQGTFDLGLNRVFIAREWYWRLVTSGFIHFGLIHLGFNMFALWSLGQLLEPITGRLEFALLYLASLLAGSAGVMLLDKNGITGGASGAVFGLFAAAAVALRQRGINPFRTSIGTVLLLNLLLTFTVPGISIGGHLGGLIGGAICGIVVFAPAQRRPPAAVVYLVPVLVGLASVGISVAVA